jgi:hypothetical protein
MKNFICPDFQHAESEIIESMRLYLVYPKSFFLVFKSSLCGLRCISYCATTLWSNEIIFELVTYFDHAVAMILSFKQDWEDRRPYRGRSSLVKNINVIFRPQRGRTTKTRNSLQTQREAPVAFDPSLAICVSGKITSISLIGVPSPHSPRYLCCGVLPKAKWQFSS